MPSRREEWAISLGEAARRLREKQGLSQEALALGCDIHRTFVSLLERGERLPSLEFVEKLAAGLGLRASELVRLAA